MTLRPGISFVIGLSAWVLFDSSGIGLAQQTAERRFEIDAARSEIFWRVYKAGTLARFGHNHIVSLPDPEGFIILTSQLSDSKVEIEFDVAALRIDDPALRGRYGEEFSSVPSAEDIAGTRGNMLGSGVLNAEQFRQIRMVGTGLSGLGGDQTLQLRLELLGRQVTKVIPIDVTVVDDTLQARGEFSLSHTELGLTPFSALMGALQVGEQLDFTFDVRALAAD